MDLMLNNSCLFSKQQEWMWREGVEGRDFSWKELCSSAKTQLCCAFVLFLNHAVVTRDLL